MVFLGLFVTYYCITNYHKFSNLNKDIYYLEVSVDQESEHRLDKSSLYSRFLT